MRYMRRPINLRLDEGLLERVDGARGDVTRTRFIERALEAALGNSRSAGEAESLPVSVPASSRAPVPGVATVNDAVLKTSPRARPSVPAIPGVKTARELAMARQLELNKAKERRR